ncbi:winged helix-turn-helix domain-containing protein [Idiomarina piscisalsi]|uniref:winged helix-turn-helix domain-containing protein n=1 Tax=Idiomarina piscisalsi TaxID=1096243 RepID=UPI00137CC6BB|nr:winged helix-turn-helix domain-containing protein [Idiomarina piscisalsi]MTJ01766.1 tetratricopeptide repeat protein [Idiomarina piscisalsi]
MQNTEYHFSGFQFQPERNLLISDSHSVILEQRVCALLVVFCKSHNKELSKAEIIEAVWPDRVVNEDSLSVAISKLRKVLSDNRHNPFYVKTLSGRGYQWLQEVTSQKAEVEPSRPKEPSAQIHKSKTKPRKYHTGLVILATTALALLTVGALHLFNAPSKQNEKSEFPKAITEQHNQAREALEVVDTEHQRKAISIARDVIKLTPDYIPAYLTVAEAKLNLSMLNSYRDIGIYRDEVSSIVDFIIEKDPANGRAWLLRAWLSHIADWEFEAAQAAYLNALKYSPDDPLVYQGYSEFLLAIGDFKQAEEFLDELRRKNPDYYRYLNMSYVYLLKGEYDLAKAEVQRIANSEAESRLSPRVLNRIAILTEDKDATFRTLKQMMIEQELSPEQITHYENLFHTQGLTSVYQELLDKRIEANLGHHLPPLSWARYALIAGDFDQAIHWLERAIEIKQPAAVFIPIDPLYEPLNQHSKFDGIKSKMQSYIRN